jgi:hypothetical protein
MSLNIATPMTVSGVGSVVAMDFYQNKVTVKLASVRRRKNIENVDEFMVDFYSGASDTIKDQLELGDNLWICGELRSPGFKTRIKAIHFDIIKTEKETKNSPDVMIESYRKDEDSASE